MTRLCPSDVYSNASLNAGHIREIMQEREYVEVSWIIQNVSERPGLQHQGRVWRPATHLEGGRLLYCVNYLGHLWSPRTREATPGINHGESGLSKVLVRTDKVFVCVVTKLKCNRDSLRLGRQQETGSGRQTDVRVPLAPWLPVSAALPFTEVSHPRLSRSSLPVKWWGAVEHSLLVTCFMN